MLFLDRGHELWPEQARYIEPRRALERVGKDFVLGVLEGEDGICYTRTGRRFFENPALEREFLGVVRAALDRSGFWQRFETTWRRRGCGSR